MTDPFSENLQAVGTIVTKAAMDIFEKCGNLDDFCIQHVGQVAVFGGCNRLLFSPLNGFYPDRSYCTEKFLEAWDRLHKEIGA